MLGSIFRKKRDMAAPAGPPPKREGKLRGLRTLEDDLRRAHPHESPAESRPSGQKSLKASPLDEKRSVEKPQEAKRSAAPAKPHAQETPETARRHAAASSVRKVQPQKRKELDLDKERGTWEARRMTGGAFVKKPKTVPSRKKPRGEAEKEGRKKYGPSPLKTYQNDIAEAVKKGGQSVARIAIAEKNRARARQGVSPLFAFSVPRKHSLLIGIAVLVVVFSVGGGILFTDTLVPKGGGNTDTPKTPSEKRPFLSFVPTDFYAQIATDNRSSETILREVRQTIFSQEEVDSSIDIVLTKKAPDGAPQRIAARTFLALWSENTPDELARTIERPFMLGAYTLASPEVFMIFSADSFEQATAGLLAWEKTVRDDVERLVGPATATTTDSFVDMIIRGAEVRALLDHKGDIVLAYSIPRTKVFVVANGINALGFALDEMSSP